MLRDFRKKILKSPISVLLPVSGLIILGLSTLFSITTTTQGQTPLNALSKQIIFMIPSLILMFIILLTPRRIIHKYIYLIYGCIIIAVTLPFFGEKIAGTYRWINFGLPFGLQPSEIAKWVIVIALARYLSDHNLKIKNIDAIVVPFLIVLFPTMIVLRQPDLGTAFVMIIPVFTMLFWIGSRPIHLFLIIAPLLGFTLLGNIALAMQFYIILQVIPSVVFKYTLSHDASGIPTTKVKLWTLSFAIASCVATLILSPNIIPIFFPQFSEVVIAIQILSICIIPDTIANIFYVSKFLGQEKSKNPLIATGIMVILTASGIIILGPIYGILGISFSFVLASLGNFTYLFFANRAFQVTQK